MQRTDNMRLWHLLMICMAILPDVYCMHLTGLHGRIASPEFPKPYGNDLNLTWNIQVPEGYKVKIYFTYFNLERSRHCEYDYVKLTSQGKKMAHLCGKESTDTEQAPEDTKFYSPDNKMTVTFRSDYSNEKEFNGFEAFYVAEDINECEKPTINNKDLCEHSCHNYVGGYFCSCPPGFGLHTDKRTCIVKCKDETSSTNTGDIARRLSFPKPTSCSYTFLAEGSSILLRIMLNDTDTTSRPDALCPNDQLLITVNGKDTTVQCGDTLPQEIDTRSNKVDIVYTTDGSGSDIKWNLQYAVKAVDCGPPEDVESGNFSFVDGINLTTYNSIIQYSCNDFYVMKDDLVRYQCGAEGKWEEINTGRKTLPVCEPDCGKTVPHAKQRIIGGSLAKLGQFPWQVHIKDSVSTASGALLYNRWILTAAHFARNVEQTKFTIAMGMIHLNDKNKYEAEPEAIYVHPSYNKDVMYNHDIALIKLKHKVPINENILGICLPTKDDRYRISEDENDHHVGRVAGWGITERGLSSKHLRFVEVDIINHSKCERAFHTKTIRNSITRNMICAGSEGKDSCSGDAGGSLAFFDDKTKRWFTGGIVSWGLDCGGKDTYGVYTKVSNHLDWIHNIIQSK